MYKLIIALLILPLSSYASEQQLIDSVLNSTQFKELTVQSTKLVNSKKAAIANSNQDLALQSLIAKKQTQISQKTFDKYKKPI